ncbi:9514_t:CDS:1, partial [Ambispora leptoticha]
MNQGLKTKIKEFTKKYFAYSQNDKSISDKVKQELEKLGAFKPFYSDSENIRSIRLTNMLNSDQEEIKKIVLKEVQKHFLVNNPEQLNSLLTEIKTYQRNLEDRMRKMKEARERK